MIKVCMRLNLGFCGSIVDVETTDLLPSTGELVTVGVLSGDGIRIFQRTGGLEEFTKSLPEGIFESPLYAFNRSFEERFLEVKVNCDLQNGFESGFAALKGEGLLSLYNRLNDPLINREIPSYWEAYWTLRNPIFLRKIVRHNYCCLCKEYYLKVRRVDGVKVSEIKPFISSAIFEAKWIRPKIALLEELAIAE